MGFFFRMECSTEVFNGMRIPEILSLLFKKFINNPNIRFIIPVIQSKAIADYPARPPTFQYEFSRQNDDDETDFADIFSKIILSSRKQIINSFSFGFSPFLLKPDCLGSFGETLLDFSSNSEDLSELWFGLLALYILRNA